MDQSKRTTLALLGLFVGSGCSALIYEIVWLQQLGLVLEATSISLAILLTKFYGRDVPGKPRVAAIGFGGAKSVASLRRAGIADRRVRLGDPVGDAVCQPRVLLVRVAGKW